MGCEKAWELMMNRLDGELGGQNLMLLENHLRICPECRKQNALLHEALLELERTKPAAPETTERKVMEKIHGARRKETAGILPYIVVPAVLLTGILAILLYGLCMGGPMLLIDKAARFLMSLYKACQSLAAVSHFLFSVPYLREFLMITGLSLLAAIIVLVSALGKRADGGAYWRSTK